MAGAPESGKSWLELWLSIVVAKGGVVWGNIVKRGTTLYLCFEDSRLRIQNRLFDITDDAPPNVHFCEESYGWAGAEERAHRTVRNRAPRYCFIIVDTLQMICRPSADNISYANNYADLSTLKKLADSTALPF